MNARTAKQSMSNKKILAIWVPILAVILVLTLVINILLWVFRDAVSSQLGYGTYTVTNTEEFADWDTDYYPASYDSLDDVIDAAEELIREIATEGFTLVKNEAEALPLTVEQPRVTLLGRTAADPIYGGSGSGAVDTSTATTIRQGLEGSGLVVNDTVYSLLSDFAADNERFVIVPPWQLDDSEANTNFRIGEMPVEEYTDEALASFADYDDAAIVVVGRGGGEAGDLTRDMSEWDENYVEGQHQLQLNQDERDALELAKEHFDTVILVVNASTSLELREIQDDPGVDAVVVAGAGGATGFEALGPILTGEVSPSGRTVDIWSADFSADPTWANWGYFAYSNIEPDSGVSPTGGGYFVQYEEGIYLGYRYYETAAVEEFIDYDEAVVYPFGYGLSYTDFSWEIADTRLGDVDEDIAIDVTVTNTGDVAGKDVVQFYVSAPYTPGGIEKAHVVLADFAKTDLLAPGESQTVTVEIPVEEMASYDYRDARAYVLDEGEYELRLQTDSHSLKQGVDPVVYTVDDTIVYSGDDHRASDETQVTNLFDDVNAMFSETPEEGRAFLMSRADFAGTFPTAPEGADFIADDEIIAGFQAYDHEAVAQASDAEMPVTGAENGLELISLRGLDYDDPLWDLLLDQLTVDEMASFILTGAYQTTAIDSIGLPGGPHADGPSGFGNFVSSALDQGVAYPSPVVLSSTWNKDLARQMGETLGEEALLRGINGWYAPGVNLHRSPFSGRNFEYYSEDPVLSGLIATEVVSGAQDKGLPAYIKHYAINDQETNRSNNGLATWADEQTIREIYLKPFEMVVKNSSSPVAYHADDEGSLETTEIGALAMMAAYNRVGAVWTGGSVPLMDTVLRGEWGFRGGVISDFNTSEYKYPDQSIAAGTDLTLAYENMKSLADTTSAEGVSNIRKATKNILFVIANSNLMNGIAPGASIEYHPPAWQYWQAGISAAIVVVIGLASFVLVRRVRRHRAMAASSAGETDTGEPDVDDPAAR